jgi:hemoglobin
MKANTFALKGLVLGAALSAAALSGGCAGGDPVANRTTGKTPAVIGIPGDSLEKFGGQAGVDVWVDDLFYYILADNRVNQIFLTHGHVQRQMALNKELENMVLGGPAQYSGASMSAAHAELGLTLTQFNAVVEDAYLACDAARTPYHVCNQLIAALAPFERVIVTK